jgi:hypothetical protein
MPCWNILSIERFGCVKSLDVHCRILLPKGVHIYNTVPFRILLSEPFVRILLSSRFRQVGFGLGFRFGSGFGFVNII